MILLYSLGLFLLGVAVFLTRRRARSLERKFYQAATAADRLLHQPVMKPGNACRSDPYQAARRHYELGLLVQRRDRLEGKFDYWQKLSKATGGWLAALRAWKGRKLPYTLGVLDVSFLLYLVDELSVGQYVGVKQLVRTAASLFIR